MAKVFISYSRKDIEFAKRLTAELQKCELDFWIDWEGIPPTVDWWREIEKGIEEADIFLFLISPDSAKSKVCGQEIDTAVKNGKRIIPAVVREINWQDTPPQLGHLNYIFFSRDGDFQTAVNKVITAIQTDYEWAATHRRLQVKALDWEKNNKDNGFLLHGMDLLDAEQDLATNTSKDPHPTDLQREYVFESRKATDRQRRTITGISIAGISILAVLTVIAIIMAVRATQQSKVSRSGELAAQSQLALPNDLQVSLLLGIESFRELDSVRSRSALAAAANAKPKIKKFLSGHTGSVKQVVISPDGTILATSGDDNSIILWNLETGQIISDPLTGHTEMITSIVFSPDGKVIASAGYDKKIRLWDVINHQLISPPLEGHAKSVNSIAFSPNGKILISGSDDGTIILWDADTHKQISKPLTDHHGSVYDLAFSPDGHRFASVNDDGFVILWDAATGKTIGQPIRPSWAMNNVLFSPDGNTLWSNSRDGSIYTWYTATLEQKGESLYYQGGYSITHMAMSPDGATLATSLSDNTIILWDIVNRRIIGEPLVGHLESINCLAFTPDSKTLVSGSNDKTIILWDISMSFNHYAQTGQLLGQLLDRRMGKLLPGSLALSSNNMILAATCAQKVSVDNCTEGRIVGLDLPKQVVIDQPIIIDASITKGVTFSPNGKRAAVRNSDSTILVWNLDTGQQVGISPSAQTGNVTVIAFSPDSLMLASGTEDGSVILWDTATGQQDGPPLAGHADRVNGLAFSPDSKTLASGSIDGTITLWEIKAREPKGHMLHPDGVISMAFDSQGKTLASGGFDGNIILWDIKTMKSLNRAFTEHTDGLYSVAFSPDGRMIAAVYAYQQIILWDIESRQPIIKSFIGDSPAVFIDNGKMLATTVYDTVALWDVDPNSWLEKSCQRAGRNFTRIEWEKYGFAEPYRKTCEQWPLDEGAAPTETATP